MWPCTCMHCNTSYWIASAGYELATFCASGTVVWRQSERHNLFHCVSTGERAQSPSARSFRLAQHSTRARVANTNDPVSIRARTHGDGPIARWWRPGVGTCEPIIVQRWPTSRVNLGDRFANDRGERHCRWWLQWWHHGGWRACVHAGMDARSCRCGRCRGVCRRCGVGDLDVVLAGGCQEGSPLYPRSHRSDSPTGKHRVRSAVCSLI